MPYDNGAAPAALPDGPVNLEAEMALLGCVLQDNSAFPSVAHLKPSAFADPTHVRCWQAVAAAINAGRTADPILVMERLRNDPGLTDLGGARYLADLLDKAPPAKYAPEYAQAVQDCFIRRDLMRHGAFLRSLAMDPQGQDAAGLLGEARRDLEAIEADTALDDASMAAAPVVAAKAIQNLRAMVEGGRTKGFMTGLRCVDRRLGGLRGGSVIIIAGRPSMGKTATARAILSGAAARNPGTNFALLSIEMDPEEMMQRELSARSYAAGEGVKYQDMGRGSVTPMDLIAIERAHEFVPGNLILDDCASLGLEDVRRKVWALKRKGPLAAIGIDYLQIMRRPRAEGRNEASVLGEITAGLKQLARWAGICIILLSQLSRQVEYRDDKRPQLSDLRESGSIEQDADAVLFPYREYYYVSRAEPKAGGKEHLEWEMKCADLERRLDVICGKQRQGAVGTDRQTYYAEYDHIEDWKE